VQLAQTPINSKYTKQSAVTSENLHTQATTPSTTTSPSRQSAVSLVGDLLNKIGVLETKLSSCRKFIRDSPWREQSTNIRRNKSEADKSIAGIGSATPTQNSLAGRQRRVYSEQNKIVQ
jgi:hypothetical protein